MVEPAFLHAAIRYCEVKVRHVELQRLIRKLPCEFEGDPDWTFCWWEYREGAICFEEACENCQTTIPLVDERRSLGMRLPNLAKKMYAAFRLEIGGLNG